MFRDNIAGLAHDVICLAELQFQLLGLDIREMWSRSLIPLVVIGGGAILALAALPVLLLSIGWLIVDMAGWTHAAAFALTAAVALLIAGVSAWVGWMRLKSALATLSRSREELANNIRWVKSALETPPAPPDRTRPQQSASS